MNLIACIRNAPSAKSGANAGSLLSAAILSLFFFSAAPCLAEGWDYMAERERIEDGMTDAERAYVREHSDTEDATSKAVAQVHRFRRVDQIYEQSGRLRTFAAFTLAALADIVQLGIIILAVVVFRRWWLVIPAGLLVGAAMWLPGSAAGPSSVWSELALEARLVAATLIACIGMAVHRTVMRSIARPAPTT